MLQAQSELHYNRRCKNVFYEKPLILVIKISFNFFLVQDFFTKNKLSKIGEIFCSPDYLFRIVFIRSNRLDVLYTELIIPTKMCNRQFVKSNPL
jgi:hypothetical protein